MSDDIFEIPNLPNMDYGAPSPTITATEHELSVEYIVIDSDIHFPNIEENSECTVFFRISGVRTFKQDTNPESHVGVFGGNHDVFEQKHFDHKFPLFRHERRKDFKCLIFAFHDSSIFCICRSYEVYLRDHAAGITHSIYKS